MASDFETFQRRAIFSSARTVSTSITYVDLITGMTIPALWRWAPVGSNPPGLSDGAALGAEAARRIEIDLAGAHDDPIGGFGVRWRDLVEAHVVQDERRLAL